jgi:predicted phosphodiesterase
MRVGIIGDLHAPFTHPMYLRFCRAIGRKYRIDRWHFVGDIVDLHALSFWDHDPNGLSAEDEACQAYDEVKAWHRAFSGASVCIGNHDERHYRVARKAGLPDRYLRSYSDVWRTPTWRWDFEHTIDGVLYEHGTGTSGKDAAINLAIQKRSSVVIGHVHSYSGVKWHANPYSIIFGLNAGCGIDCQAYAFAYGKSFPVRPVLGCGVVIDGDFATFEKMPCGRGERFHRSKAGKRRRTVKVV